MKLKDYLQKKKISISQAAREIPCSREWIYKHLSGTPFGYRTAMKVNAWTKGRVPVHESMKIKG
jgi:hypothetical protein